jgi:hypothetical protein
MPPMFMQNKIFLDRKGPLMKGAWRFNIEGGTVNNSYSEMEFLVINLIKNSSLFIVHSTGGF